MNNNRLGIICVFICLHVAFLNCAFSQSAAFRYQGSLRVDGWPALGNYDMRFGLFDGEAGGAELGVVTNAAVSVSNSLFAVTLDFGDGLFTGTNYWLEIGVAPAGSGGPFQALQPRQPLVSVPYAVHARSAAMLLPSVHVVPLTNMVLIPAGSFVLGSLADEQDREPDEGPVTSTSIRGAVWMGIYEVTQGEYQQRMGSNPSAFTGDARRPVENVTWNDAMAYCAALTAEQRAAGNIPNHYEYRLPTEAEWERACRAGTGTRFHYGDDPAYADLARHAWYTSNSAGTTHPVGEKRPNAWGLYDMHGNVWEWCRDFYQTNYNGGAAVDPRGADSGVNRVLRGGSWSTLARICRSARRFQFAPDLAINDFGFRVVLAEVRP